MMNRRTLGHAALCATAVAWLGLPLSALAADEAPDALVKRLSADVLEKIRTDKNLKAGDINRVISLVDRDILPHVNFRRMTAAAVGPGWRQATPEQQGRLQEEFKTLLVRTYSGALNQVNTNVSINVKPLRAQPQDKDVLVRTEILGRGDPIQLDYRLEKTPGEGAGWKIYNLNVMGVWLVDTYRSQFAQEINAKGVDGLIEALAARNKANAGSGGKAS
ncbi:ABC transporter substrate-binding protein [Paracidovorax wautersii]|uniref:Phospholipid transport system substrate-binding protein n=1 Tax=Paracidovorax wautersii TaxID=1177982 RepID=A0ABU1I5X1_9BURK|nr:ABC transporter substrate-binding protein [Paracidovorax wautersii]MDR6212617.1 phospholipid transport system substrate-binding protein [Paracidovorax wautersii]